MICSQISSLLGVSCHPLNEDGSVAMIDTSFLFEDGDPLPVYLEKFGTQIRFFDDGEVIQHFLGRGIAIDNANKSRFIKSVAEANGVVLNQMGELEIWSSESNAPEAFAKYICTMIGLTHWEKDQIGVGSDTSILIEEVAQCLRSLDPKAAIVEAPEYTGISGQVYKLDFDFKGEAVIAISPHFATVNAAIKKLLDIKSAPGNAALKIMAVIDDRYDSKAAKKEALIMDALATVWPMSRLEETAGITRMSH